MYEALSDVLSDERDRCEACGDTEELVTCSECYKLFCPRHAEYFTADFTDYFVCDDCLAAAEAADVAN